MPTEVAPLVIVFAVGFWGVYELSKEENVNNYVPYYTVNPLKVVAYSTVGGLLCSFIYSQLGE